MQTWPVLPEFNMGDSNEVCGCGCEEGGFDMGMENDDEFL